MQQRVDELRKPLLGVVGLAEEEHATSGAAHDAHLSSQRISTSSSSLQTLTAEEEAEEDAALGWVPTRRGGGSGGLKSGGGSGSRGDTELELRSMYGCNPLISSEAPGVMSWMLTFSGLLSGERWSRRWCWTVFIGALQLLKILRGVGCTQGPEPVSSAIAYSSVTCSIFVGWLAILHLKHNGVLEQVGAVHADFVTSIQTVCRPAPPARVDVVGSDGEDRSSTVTYTSKLLVDPSYVVLYKAVKSRNGGSEDVSAGDYDDSAVGSTYHTAHDTSTGAGTGTGTGTGTLLERLAHAIGVRTLTIYAILWCSINVVRLMEVVTSWGAWDASTDEAPSSLEDCESDKMMFSALGRWYSVWFVVWDTFLFLIPFTVFSVVSVVFFILRVQPKAISQAMHAMERQHELWLAHTQPSWYLNSPAHPHLGLRAAAPLTETGVGVGVGVGVVPGQGTDIGTGLGSGGSGVGTVTVPHPVQLQLLRPRAAVRTLHVLLRLAADQIHLAKRYDRTMRLLLLAILVSISVRTVVFSAFLLAEPTGTTPTRFDLMVTGFGGLFVALFLAVYHKSTRSNSQFRRLVQKARAILRHRKGRTVSSASAAAAAAAAAAVAVATTATSETVSTGADSATETSEPAAKAKAAAERTGTRGQEQKQKQEQKQEQEQEQEPDADAPLWNKQTSFWPLHEEQSELLAVTMAHHEDVVGTARVAGATGTSDTYTDTDTETDETEAVEIESQTRQAKVESLTAGAATSTVLNETHSRKPPRAFTSSARPLELENTSSNRLDGAGSTSVVSVDYSTAAAHERSLEHMRRQMHSGPGKLTLMTVWHGYRHVVWQAGLCTAAGLTVSTVLCVLCFPRSCVTYTNIETNMGDEMFQCSSARRALRELSRLLFELGAVVLGPTALAGISFGLRPVLGTWRVIATVYVISGAVVEAWVLQDWAGTSVLPALYAVLYILITFYTSAHMTRQRSDGMQESVCDLLSLRHRFHRWYFLMCLCPVLALLVIKRAALQPYLHSIDVDALISHRGSGAGTGEDAAEQGQRVFALVAVLLPILSMSLSGLVHYFADRVPILAPQMQHELTAAVVTNFMTATLSRLLLFGVDQVNTVLFSVVVLACVEVGSRVALPYQSVLLHMLLTRSKHRAQIKADMYRTAQLTAERIRWSMFLEVYAILFSFFFTLICRSYYQLPIPSVGLLLSSFLLQLIAEFLSDLYSVQAEESWLDMDMLSFWEDPSEQAQQRRTSMLRVGLIVCVGCSTLIVWVGMVVVRFGQQDQH